MQSSWVVVWVAWPPRLAWWPRAPRWSCWRSEWLTRVYGVCEGRWAGCAGARVANCVDTRRGDTRATRRPRECDSRACRKRGAICCGASINSIALATGAQPWSRPSGAAPSLPACRYLLPGGSAAHFKREGYTFDVGSSMMFGMGGWGGGGRWGEGGKGSGGDDWEGEGSAVKNE